MTPLTLRVASACAVASAVTTFLLWLLPRYYAPPESFEQAVSLHENAYAMARLWVNFVHVFLALVAYGATAYVLAPVSRGLAAFGSLSFLLWGFTELLGVTVNIFAVNRTWRAGFRDATPEMQTAIRTNLAAFQAVWDAMFFLLLVGFLLGSACFGLAAVLRDDVLGRCVGAMFVLAVPLTVGILLGGYTRFTALDPIVAAVYPVLQPASRALLGYWLWREAGDTRRSVAATIRRST